MWQKIRNNWHLAIAIVLIALSLSVLFGLTGLSGTQDDTSQEDSLTTLKFGLELEGGTRITVPLHGVTAEEVELSEDANHAQLERGLAENLGVAPTEVNLQQNANQQTGEVTTHIEVTSESVTQSDLRSALDAGSIQYDTVREGVTQTTRERTVEVITNKINEAGLSGGTARIITSATGDRFVLIEIPGEDRENVINLLEDRGSVRIDIYYPTENEDGERIYQTREAVLEKDDFQSIGTASRSDQLGPHVPVTLTEDAALDFKESTTETGMVPSGSRCFYEEQPESTEPCLLTKVDGEVVYSAGMDPGLAQNIGSGEWEKAPQFVLQTSSMDEASELSLHLTAGALPTGLDFDSGTTMTISPTQGEQFKIAGFLIGLAAILGVGIKVFVRYRDLRVAVPMIVMSLAEVVILLGAASLIGYPLGLAVVAGFIAVIGTGVDDLIIIANEVLAKGDVNSRKVFKSRYKKAFWIIMAAAITTSVALSPLIVLSLGKLSGFALFTIFGILIGVTITRPAYGEILNSLLTDQ